MRLRLATQSRWDFQLCLSKHCSPQHLGGHCLQQGTLYMQTLRAEQTRPTKGLVQAQHFRRRRIGEQTQVQRMQGWTKTLAIVMMPHFEVRLQLLASESQHDRRSQGRSMQI